MTSSRHSPALLPVLFIGIFMIILDIFIVMVAAPSLRSDLGASETEVQWVVAAYLVAYAITLITAGRLGDILGRRRMLRIGFAVFTLASALCAAAPSPAALIGARVLQGLGAAAMWPQVLSIVQVEFTPDERPRAFALQGVVQGLGSVTGQILGGGLISLNLLGLGWRWVFLVNVPVGLAAVILAGRVVPESRSPSARRLDIPGVALATIALALLLIPIVEGRDLGWPWWSFAILAAAAPAGAAFVAWERRVHARGGSPLMELGLFAQRGFRVGISAAVIQFTVPSFFLFLGLYLQEGAGLTPIESGLAFTPLAVAFAGGSLLGPRLGRAAIDLLPAVGAATAALGLGTTIAALLATGDHYSPVVMIVATIPVGLGMGIFVPPLINLVLRMVPTRDAGAASGTLVTGQQIGNALGVAVVGTVFFGQLGSATDLGSFGGAFAAACAVQAVLALAGAALALRVREHSAAPAERAVERGEVVAERV
jgi:EmrB/QacA subfamily drug resistance transporter